MVATGMEVYDPTELDEFGYYLVSIGDGVRPLSDLSAELGCGSDPGETFLQLVGQLCEAGILGLELESEVAVR